MLIYLKRIGIALSVLLNVTLGGKSNQTFSARNWERKRQGKIHFVFAIDGVCIFIGYIISFVLTMFHRRHIIYKLDDHCMESWIYWRSRKDVIYELDEGDKEWLKLRVENPKETFRKEFTAM